MRVFMNFREVRSPYGGANSFLRTLVKGLRRSGVSVTNDARADVDVALLNALTDGLELDAVRALAERGVPIVHRKVNYRASGSPEMRAVVDGVVEGDRRQLEFTPYVAHTIFQSDYSREVYTEAGFGGPHTVIHNGVDEEVFNQNERVGLLRKVRPRRKWVAPEVLRVAISTWSTDENKGFRDYGRLDDELARRDDVEVTLVGRLPEGQQLAHIRHKPPRRARQLAGFLKSQHVLLQLARHETCSNALIEGMNCGLPPIYVDSGSNAELAAPYGVAWEGDFPAAFDTVRERYEMLVAKLADNPYRMQVVLPRYLSVLEHVAAGDA